MTEIPMLKIGNTKMAWHELALGCASRIPAAGKNWCEKIMDTAKSGKPDEEVHCKPENCNIFKVIGEAHRD